jgi:hypothetical protein
MQEEAVVHHLLKPHLAQGAQEVAEMEVADLLQVMERLILAQVVEVKVMIILTQVLVVQEFVF